MGFTQEKKINLDVCDFCVGCEGHCRLGIDFYTTEDSKSVACPTIGGKKIKEFLCKDGTLKSAEKEAIYNSLRLFTKKMIDKARKIATLCDKYKAR
jgi:hypothetical protein